MKNLRLLITSVILLLSFLISFQSCSDDKEVYMWIASELAYGTDPIGGSERPYYQYKLKETDDWQYLSPLIIGFDDYEEGYEYVLLVKIESVKNPVEDQDPQRYTLIKVISKKIVEAKKSTDI